ncbi:hypothetical protein ACFL35_10525 [Candidatus Riflebacteria bacterium]
MLRNIFDSIKEFILIVALGVILFFLAMDSQIPGELLTLLEKKF